MRPYTPLLALTLSVSMLLSTSPAYASQPMQTTISVKKQEPEIFPVEVNYKWGFINKQNQVVIEPKYDSVERTYSGYYKIKRGDNIGYVSMQGRILLDAVYKDVLEIESLLAPFDGKSWGIMTPEGKWMFRPQFAQIDPQYNLDLRRILIKVQKGSKWGLITESGTTLIAPQYDELNYIHRDGSSQVRVGNKWGLFDSNGKLVIPVQYQAAHPFSEGLALVKKNNLYGFVNPSGKLVIPLRYALAHDVTMGRAIVRSGTKWGAIDTTGKLVIPTQYATLGLLRHNLAKTQIQGKWAVIAPGGKLLTQAVYDAVFDEPNNFTVARKGSQSSFITLQPNGTYYISPLYDEYTTTPDGKTTLVKQNGKWGIIDQLGKVVLQPTYEDIRYRLDQSQLYAVQSAGKWLFINQKGEPINNERYDDIRPIQGGNHIVTRNGAEGVVDSSGKTVVPLEYQSISPDDSGMYRVSRDDKWGVLDAKGQSVLPPVYDLVSINEQSGFIHIVQNKKEGLYLLGKKTLIPPTYDGIRFQFSPDAYFVLTNGKWGLIGHDGQVLLPPTYDEPGYPTEGMNPVQFGGKWGFVTAKGTVLAAPAFDEVSEFANGFARVRQRDKWAYLNDRGELITPFRFDQAEPFESGRAQAKLGGKLVYLNTKGEIIYQPTDATPTEFTFTYKPFTITDQKQTLQLLSELTTNTTPEFQAHAANTRQVALAYRASWGEMNTGSQIDAYYAALSTFLLDVYQMVGTLDAKPTEIPSGGTSRPTEISHDFIRSLIDSGYISAEEYHKNTLSREVVAHVLYNIFHQDNPAARTITPKDTKDPALIWAVSIGLPSFAPDEQGNIKPKAGSNVSEFTQDLLYCSYLLKFPQKGKPAASYSYDLKQPSDFSQAQATDPLDKQLYINGAVYQDFISSHPELAQNRAFTTALEQAKQKLREETRTLLLNWLDKKRKEQTK
ncbi:WG repeat-containing protein [Brevibacillus dissolubilis]|uniref:WG repeat-containing protein n=1 Tax=Brevibacillus dissolubilis TaxID=1844116 RepID=UPI00159BC03A|nr:WG repeat-containing protein [Brevibacillus dissolubilis]